MVGDAGQLDAGVLSHVLATAQCLRAEYKNMKAANRLVISGEAPKTEWTQECCEHGAALWG